MTFGGPARLSVTRKRTTAIVGAVGLLLSVAFVLAPRANAAVTCTYDTELDGGGQLTIRLAGTEDVRLVRGENSNAIEVYDGDTQQATCTDATVNNVTEVIIEQS